MTDLDLRDDDGSVAEALCLDTYPDLGNHTEADRHQPRPGTGSVRDTRDGLLAAVGRHDAHRPAFSDPQGGATLTFGTLREAAMRSLARLRTLDVGRGDAVAVFAEGRGLELMPALLACAGAGMRLIASDAATSRSAATAIVDHCRPKLVIAPRRGHAGWSFGGDVRLLTPEEWAPGEGEVAEALATRWTALPDLADEPCLIAYTAGTTGEPKPVLLTPAGLARAARAVLESCSIAASDVVFAASPLASASGICMAGMVPMLAGAHAVLAGRRALDGAGAYWAAAERVGATVCELPAWRVPAVLDGGVPAKAPRCVRFVLCNGGGLSEAQRRAAEAAWGLPVRLGYGTAETGYWAASTAHGRADMDGEHTLLTSAGTSIRLRPLRAPLMPLRPAQVTRLEPAAASPAIGEILVRSAATTPGYHRRNNVTHVAFEAGYFRTGDVGALDGDGGLGVLGRCGDLAIRKVDGALAGLLLGEIDALLARHPAIAESKTVLDCTGGRGERIVTVCVAAAPIPDLRTWLADQGVSQVWLPDQIVLAAALPRAAGGEVSADLVRSMANGRLAGEVVEALTARRFRRNPPYREDALRQLAQDAVLGHGPLRFLMFWGCGQRRDAAEPDLAALAALDDLLDAVRRAHWLRTEATVIFTDCHATANGHPEEHSSAYFGSVERAANGLGVRFERESQVWAAGGLSVEQVRRFAATPELEEEWQRFPLRKRFVEQATRHSRRADSEAAARHYFATCKLERRVLAEAYPRAVFLTYNGPEFNECFPDLPTLYVYPGPRGRTVKPWFI